MENGHKKAELGADGKINSLPNEVVGKDGAILRLVKPEDRAGFTTQEIGEASEVIFVGTGYKDVPGEPEREIQWLHLGKEVPQTCLKGQEIQPKKFVFVVNDENVLRGYRECSISIPIVNSHPAGNNNYPYPVKIMGPIGDADNINFGRPLEFDTTMRTLSEAREIALIADQKRSNLPSGREHLVDRPEIGPTWHPGITLTGGVYLPIQKVVGAQPLKK